MSEIAIQSDPAVWLRAVDRTFVHIETNRCIGAKRALVVLGCGPGGELEAPGQVAALGGAPPKTDTAVSDRIF